MTDQTGGVAAAFGFRYQYLITVEILLELFETCNADDWFIDVDLAGQDSADILVGYSVSGTPERAIQVKASLPESSTTIGTKKLREVFATLAKEHPLADMRELVTNRRMTAELNRELHAKGSTVLAPHERFVPRDDSLSGLTSALLQRIGHLRCATTGGVGDALHYLLLRYLIDMVHEAGSRPDNQRITREDVRRVIEGPAPVLANALGVRRWGMCIQVPMGHYIERSDTSVFLRHSLTSSALYDGAPRVAVIHGISGTGKTAAASFFARSQLEHLAFVLWFDASSPAVLQSQLPVVLRQLGARVPATEPTAEDLKALLSELPVPWLLVLDGAQSLDDIDPWVPRSGYGQILITTTRSDWPKDFAPNHQLTGFNQSESRAFFAERLNQPESSWSSEQLDSCDQIADALSHWPLALDLAVAWIQRRGATLDTMQNFANHLERLNLDDTHLVPHGYPRTAVQAIANLLLELSPSATRVLSVLRLFGGDRVPEQLITECIRNLGLPDVDPLEELTATSIIQRRISTGEVPHEFDETVNIHDFIKLVLHGQGVALDGISINAMIEASEHSLLALTEQGHFREGATLVHPVDYFLRELVKSLKEDSLILIRLSVLMHNLAQMAFLTSNIAVARTWYVAAFNVRRADPAYFEQQITGIQMQLQTLAGAASVMAYQRDTDGLRSVTECVHDLARGASQSILESPEAQTAIMNIYHNVAFCLPEDVDRIAALKNLLHVDDISQQFPPGNAKVTGLQEEMAYAICLVETDRWPEGVEAALTTANHAMEDNLLVDMMLGGLLDVGFELVLAMYRRQHDLPGGLLECLRQVTTWFRENPTDLDGLKKQRLSLLESVATGEPKAIRTAVIDLPRTEQTTPMILAWTQLVTAVADQLERFRQREMFSNLPEGVTVNISVNGGDDINFWQTIEPLSGVPILWVCTASQIRFDSNGKSDPLREMFVSAGLPQGDDEGKVQPAHGWLATLERNSLTINDPYGTTLVSAGELEPVFCERIRALRGLVLAYGDLALAKPSQGSPPRGWVPLAGGTRTERSRGLTNPPGDGDSHSRAGWLRHLTNWWRRQLRMRTE